MEREIWPEYNDVNYLTWREFWYPNRVATDEMNKLLLQSNKEDSNLNASMSLALTEKENRKIIMALVLVCIVIVIVY